MVSKEAETASYQEIRLTFQDETSLFTKPFFFASITKASLKKYIKNLFKQKFDLLVNKVE